MMWCYMANIRGMQTSRSTSYHLRTKHVSQIENCHIYNGPTNAMRIQEVLSSNCLRWLNSMCEASLPRSSSESVGTYTFFDIRWGHLGWYQNINRFQSLEGIVRAPGTATVEVNHRVWDGLSISWWLNFGELGSNFISFTFDYLHVRSPNEITYAVSMIWPRRLLYTFIS